jgi:hypothetical protein
MPDIEKGLVHTVVKDHCVNCKLPKAAHLDGACMFDVTQFQEETVNDHLDCTCETVSEISDPVIKKDGTLVINGVIQRKEPINYVTLTFTI